MKPLVALVGLGLIGPAFAGSERLVELLDTYCVDCHDDTDASGEVNFEPYVFGDKDVARDGKLLEMIDLVVRSGEMPPREEDQPSAGEHADFLASAEELYRALATEKRDHPGYVVMPRLTKSQYRRVIRDLSGGVVEEAGSYLPSEGGAGEGFDNVGEAQSLGTAQLEKFLEAARLSLRHLRVTPAAGFSWSPVPLEPVDEPAQARLDAVNEINAWFVRQQYLWAFDFEEELMERFGSERGAYLEAAWIYENRRNKNLTLEEVAAGFDPPLPISPLRKFHRILTAKEPAAPWKAWVLPWQALPADLDAATLRERCRAIALEQASQPKTERREDFAPPWEVSFGPETLQRARDEKTWPFFIEIGDAKELFLVVTDAGNEGRNETGIWQNGAFHFADGSTTPWQQVTKIRGANSGKIFPWGQAEGSEKLGPDQFPAKPPGALKIEVPAGATHLEVELALADPKAKATIQAIILKEKPDRDEQRFIPGRLVFGGGSFGDVKHPHLKERRKLLNRANIPAANVTKAGLNAERNTLATWDRTPLEFIGGPWDHQPADESDPLAPFHLTAAEVIECAKPEALAELKVLFDRLESVVQIPHQKLARLAADAGWKQPKETFAVPQDLRLPAEAKELLRQIESEERANAATLGAAIREFATRAWCRPLDDAEFGVLVKLYGDSRRAGFSYDASVKQALLAVLASPHFLYQLPARPPLAAGEKPAPLSSYELASRLSFFLWGSIPDDELLAAAASGALREDDELRRQVRRMIADPRSRSLAEDFAGQVFGSVGFEASADPERFPDFTKPVRDAMIEEVHLFMENLVRGEAPVTDLLNADYSFLNEPLARYYGVDGVEGPGFQKATLPANRGGLVTMGLFLTKTSEPLRTSPVVRGNWVLEAVLGRHLPSPPPVPAISQDETDEQGRSIRQQLEAHRENAACASCHDKIDPLGIALENFDPVGRWRDELRDGSKPDTAATTHDGVALSGSADLKGYLAGRTDEVTRHLTRKLLGYALGRGKEPGDLFLLERLARELPAHDHRLPFLIEEIALSPQFRHRG